ncbi:MAG: hypothetical protein FJ110_11765 [Deltaproteobacteria bacterium]|nr:hypothetical protein [Deltaproteobacteria bacterium]
MKWCNVPVRAISLFSLVVLLFLPCNRVFGQGTPTGTPDARQESVTTTDQTPPLPVAQPEVIPEYILTIGRTGNGFGKVTNSPAGIRFKKGTSVTIDALPEVNSIFTGWSGSCSGSSRTCLVTMTADKTVTASFSLKTYTIRVPFPVNGVIHPSGTIKAFHGEKRRFQIIPLPGYRVSEVLVDKVSVGALNSYTLNNITSDHVVEAIFTKE